MKKIVVLYASFNSGYQFEKSFDSKSAFELCLDWAREIKDSLKTVILCNNESYDTIKELLDKSENSSELNISLVQDENWTNALAAKKVYEECKTYNADFAVFACADTPFLNKNLTLELIKSHEEYRAEYTFADGFADGLAPQIVDRGASSIIAGLGEDVQKTAGQKPFSRNGFFEIMSGDINSFEIETVLADKDYRMLRFNFECSSKAGFTSCVRLFNEAQKNKIELTGGNYDIYKLSDLAESLVCLQQSLPSFYNIQISNSYNTKSLYCPYEKLFNDKKLPCMDINDFKILVKKIVDFSEDAVVSLSLFGEPTLNSDFTDFALEVLKYPSLKLFIETDGLNFLPEIAQKIADSAQNKERIDIVVQLDSTDENMYEKINGIAGANFNKAFENICMLSKIFPQHVYPQFTRMNANESQLEAFYRFWNEKTNPSGGQLVITKYDSFAGLLNDEKVADLSPLERNSCWHLRRDFNILSDGSVPLCRTRAAEIAGNAFSDDFEEIWKKISVEVQNHMNKNYCDRCLTCDEYYTFNF